MRGDLGETLKRSVVRRGEPMSGHTTFRVGGPADYFVLPGDFEELTVGLAWCGEEGVPVFLLGAGSNVVFSDEGYRGAVFCLKSLNHMTLDGDKLTAACGVGLPALAQKAAKNALTGLEFLSGIPGTVGGGVRMNAGCYGLEMSDVVESVAYLSQGGVCVCPREKLGFGYRKNGFLGEGDVVLSATFALRPGSRELIGHRMRELNSLRRLKQPLEYPSAGSAFKRPASGYAAAYIDGAGLKGYRIGGAAVSGKHAGFVVNLGNAKSRDVRKLIDYIAKVVYNKYNVKLEPEIVFVP